VIKELRPKRATRAKKAKRGSRRKQNIAKGEKQCKVMQMPKRAKGKLVHTVQILAPSQKTEQALCEDLLRTKLIEKIYFIKSKCVLSKINSKDYPVGSLFYQRPAGRNF
jgi:hypothetical protein